VKIPTKKELLELQRKYRTDKKIGEVFGVPGRLVAYWRSKKKIGTYNQPKYSRDKILELWERFGNDKLAGLELGITGAGFRQWRIKYGFKSKPLRLKFEQLELSLPEEAKRNKFSRKETFVQKLLARKAGLKSADEGQVIEISPDVAVSGIEALSVYQHFREMGGSKIWDKSKVAIIYDRPVDTLRNVTPALQKQLKDFIRKQGLEKFYDIGWGSPYQVMVEEGLILPNHLAVGTGRHVLSFGGLGAFASDISPLDMAAVWAEGRIWLKIPPTIKIVIKGSVPRGVYARDLILKLFHDFGKGGANYRALEFYGETISTMAIAQRLVMATFAGELNAKSAYLPFDDLAQKHCRKFTKQKLVPIVADHDAHYENELEINVSYLTPQVAVADHQNAIRPIEEFSGKKIDLIVLGGCAHGSLTDLDQAAAVLRGRRVHRDTRVIIIPGSRKAYLEAVEKGLVRLFIESGCVVSNPGSDFRQWSTGDNERAFTTCACARIRERETYSGSPATAAATALEGAIADPRRYLL